MTQSLLNVGGTLTGGTTVALQNAGQNSSTGKSVFYTPAHTRLAAREVDFYVGTAKTTNTDPGVARAGTRIMFANRDSVAGCCTAQSGSVIIDINARWSLNQPDTLVDEAIDYASSLINSPQFLEAIKKGFLPQ
jgi:hypothetical protein